MKSCNVTLYKVNKKLYEVNCFFIEVSLRKDEIYPWSGLFRGLFSSFFFFKYNNFVKIKWNFKYIKKYDIKIPFLFYKNAKNLRTIFEN